MSGLLEILEQFKSLLETAERDLRTPVVGQINVTGGEPFLRADFLELLRAIASNRPRIVFGIMTNGSFIDSEKARELHDLGPQSVQVSIEGGQETHDRVRGLGNFDRVVAAIKTLVRNGVRTSISFTANRLNYREFPEVARLARTMGASTVWSDRLIPIGGCQIETLTPTESRHLFMIMRECRDEAERSWLKGGTNVALGRALQFLEGGSVYHCSAGDGGFTVLPNGDVVPCRRMPIPVGNAFDQPLATLYFESDIMRSLRDPERVSKGCQNCRFEPACRGGLRCLSYAMTGDPFRADPGCWLAE